MSTIIGQYWGDGGLEQKEKRFQAISEIYPIKDLKIQLQKLKEIIEDILERNSKNMIKEEKQAICIIKKEVESLLSKEVIAKSEYDFISKLLFNAANMPMFSFLGLI